jgi:tetratricopeptide (TPR) repeat protein
VVVSPDAGRVKVAERYANDLHADLAIVHKRRVKGEERGRGPRGHRRGRGPHLRAHRRHDRHRRHHRAPPPSILMEHGAVRGVGACHPRRALRPGHRPAEELVIEKVVITNTLPLPPEKQIDKIEVLSVAPIIADAIDAVFEDTSVSEIFGGENQLGPFVGRRRELDRLLAAWAAAKAGEPRFAAVAGEPGIGKTRLVAELAADVHADGGTVLWGRCTAEVLTAYQPFVEALRPLEGVGGAVTTCIRGNACPLAPFFPDDASARSGSAIDQYALFTAVSELLETLTGSRPALLVLDDLHWTDTTTASLLGHLFQRPPPFRLLVVGAFRAAEVSHPHPMARVVGDLRRERLVVDVPLAGLDSQAAATLARHIAGGLSDDEVARVYAQTEGNPFFVEELASWSVADDGRQGGLPTGVRDILQRRIGLVGAEGERLLGAAAVLGREFDADLLRHMTGSDDDAVLELLEAAMAAHLVTEVPTPLGRFSFAHALIRQALLDGMTRLRRSRLHRAAARAIEERRLHELDEHVAELVHHLLEADDPADDPRTLRHLVSAMTRAVHVAAHMEALEHGRRAEAILHRHPDPLVRCDVLTLTAAAQISLGDLDASSSAAREAAELARAAGDGARLARVATFSSLGMGVGVAFDYGAADAERVQRLRDALALVGDDDPALKAWTQSYLAVALLHAPGWQDEAAAVSAEALATAESIGRPGLLSAACIGRRIALWHPWADPEERRANGWRGIRAADEDGLVSLRVVTRIAFLADLLELADLDGFERVLGESEEIVAPLGQPRFTWLVQVARAGLLLARGRYDEAEPLIDRAVHDVGGAQGATPLGTYGGQRLLLERDTGSLDTSVANLQAAAVALPGMAVVRAGLALALAESGRLDEARSELDAALGSGVAAIPADYVWPLTLGWLGETAAMVGAAHHAAAIEEALEGRDERLLSFGGAGTSGLVGRVRGILAHARGDLPLAASRLEGALAGHERLAMRPWVARTAAELAAVERDRGHRTRAQRLRGQAVDLADTLGLVLPGGLTLR